MAGNWYSYPHLTIDGVGYVYWKGIKVDHYSLGAFADDRAVYDAQERLARRCQHLETIGIAVNGNSAVWFESWFSDMTKQDLTDGTVDPDFIQRFPGFYEADDGRRLVRWGGRYVEGETGTIVTGVQVLEYDGQEWTLTSVPDYPWRFELDHPYEYHGLVARGFKIARLRQPEHCGVCYASTAGLLDLLHRWKIPGAGVGRPFQTEEP